MRRLFRTIYMVVLLGVSSTLAHASEHDEFTRLLSTYVVEDAAGATFVDYEAWASNAADREALKTYIAELSGLDIFSTMDRDQEFAAWANLYNALTLHLVLDAYPVSSIRKIHGGVFNRGPWKKKIVQVAGRSLSLDDIEHGILRAGWSDPRIHYSVNCASIGCPNIRAEAWEAETLDEDLDNAARAFINHPRAVRRDGDNGLVLSSIFKWYRDDFGDGEDDVAKHLTAYAAPELFELLQRSTVIDGYAYDWTLNDAKNMGAAL